MLDTIRINALMLIHQHTALSLVIAVLFIVIALFIIRKIKTLAIILILISAVILYASYTKGDIDTSKVDELKKKTKVKIIEKIREQ